MKSIRKMDGLSTTLMAAGAINWGLVALTKRDAVGRVFGRKSSPARTIYSIIGVAALYKIGRIVAPKPAQEKRAQKVMGLLDRLDYYAKTFEQYQTRATKLAAEGRKNLDKTRQLLAGSIPALR